MIEFSLCMIVKNEESVLGRCLDSIGDLASEIVIVDTGSTDATEAVASRYTDRIYHFAWEDDFGAARNFSFSQASKPYCMWLDADDVLLPEDRLELLRLKNSLPPETDMVMLPYHTGFDADQKPTFTYYRERIVRNSPNFRWEGAVHECIPPSGNIVYGKAAVTHQKLKASDPDRNLRILEGRIQAGKTLTPREQYYYARELYYHDRFEDAAGQFSSFLASGRGWVENNIEACRFLSYCQSRLGQKEEALHSLLQSFSYDIPRAETCCDIGNYFIERSAYRQAAYWYEQALNAVRDDTAGGFVEPDCYGYLPCLQLCVCWYHLGDPKKAMDYNERAAALKPSSPACAYNRTFFKNLENHA